MFASQVICLVLSLTIGLSEACVEGSCPDNCDCQCSRTSITIQCKELYGGELEKFFIQQANTTTELHFHHSQLKDIPKSICLLTKMRHLDLGYNNLANITNHGIACFQTTLVELHLGYNRIDTLMDGLLDGFEKLEVFSVEHNKIKAIKIHHIFGSVPSLRSIQLSWNKLTSFDMAFFALPALRDHMVQVNISHNCIQNITNNLEIRHSNLPTNMSIHVILRYNNISTVDTDGIAHMLNVSSVLKLTKFSKSEIDIRFNPFLCDCRLSGFVSLLKYLKHNLSDESSLLTLYCSWKSGVELYGKLLYIVNNKTLNCVVKHRCPVSCECRRTGKTLDGKDFLDLKCNTNYTSETLPKMLPLASEINIEFYKTGLKRITADDVDSQTYLHNVSKFNMPLNKINLIAVDILQYLNTMKMIYLHQNKITSLPDKIRNLTFPNLVNMTLHDNPWNCDCNAKWMKSWIRSFSNERLPLRSNIECRDGLGKGKAILDVPDEDFVCNPLDPLNPSNPKNQVVTIVLTAFCVVTSFSLSIYCLRKPLRVLLLSRFNFSFLRKYMKANLTYDVFISYSSHDERWVTNVLVPALEKNDPPYKVCIHYKDFDVGECIANNIIKCVDSSLSTLLVLSNNFLESEWCRFEFQSAHHRFLKEKKSYMILVLLEDLDSQNMDNEMTHYLRTKTYLKISDHLFWPKIFYSLPLRRITNEEHHTDEDESDEPDENQYLINTQRRRVRSC